MKQLEKDIERVKERVRVAHARSVSPQRLADTDFSDE
jgi:hypothetical protein